MVPILRVLVVVLSLTVWCQADPGPGDRRVAPEAVLDGAWSGSWGGGERDGVVFQPVLADCVIRGTAVEFEGLRRAGSGHGTLAVDAARQRLTITAGGRSHVFRFAVQGETLTLTDEENVVITLQRVPTEVDPLADLSVELVAARGFDKDGAVQVMSYTGLRTEKMSRSLSRARVRSVSMSDARILLIGATDVRTLTVDEARGRLIEATAVVLATRPRVEHPASGRDLGPWAADSPVAAKTLLRLFRPGTLVFVVPEPVVLP